MRRAAVLVLLLSSALAALAVAAPMAGAANGPLAVRAAKQSIDGTYWREREAWLSWEAEQAVGPLLSEDRKAGMQAAAERKRADFQGK